MWVFASDERTCASVHASGGNGELLRKKPRAHKDPFWLEFW
jgi:hypothetical protein